MKIAVLVARILLGLPLVAFGSISLFRLFEPDPDQFEAEAWAFLQALEATGYLHKLNSLVEVVCGALLLAGRYVPLALALLAPTMVNIVLFHAVLDAPARGVVAYLLFGLYLLAVWNHWPSYRGMLVARGETRVN